MGNVRIVTDSAGDLPQKIADAQGIKVVPLTVNFGNESFVSGVELGTDEFWRKLGSTEDFPSTAAPSAGDFEQAYRELLDDGADGVVSIHISSKLSATYQAATNGARALDDDRVHVVDTFSVSAAQGMLAIRASEMASGGAAAKEIADEVNQMRERLAVFFVIDTLEYLRRGGRIGGAQALLGTMLKVKPVLGLADGEVQPVGRVRTRAKSLEHLAGLVAEHAGNISDIYVVHGDAEDIDRFLGHVEGTADVPSDHVWSLGPVVGAHVGPGVIGVAMLLGG